MCCDSVKGEMPAFLTLGDADAVDDPRASRQQSCQSRGQVSVKHKALDELRYEASQRLGEPHNGLNGIATMYIQADSGHVGAA